MPRLTLPFKGVELGTDYHAAYVALHSRRGVSMAQHTHTFWEVFLILEGSGRHRVEEEETPLEAGHLVLIRPEDFHMLQAHTRRPLHFINVTFPTSLWTEFCTLSGLQQELEGWATVSLPPTVWLEGSAREEIAHAFRELLRVFNEQPIRYALMRFWGVILPHLFALDPMPAASFAGEPLWLTLAAQALKQPENLRLGHAALLELSGVTAAHLARTFRQFYGQTPTEFINTLRLKRAAMLLSTTNQDILEVSSSCGFETLSYFYRLFSKQFGQTPKAFRLSTMRISAAMIRKV